MSSCVYYCFALMVLCLAVLKNSVAATRKQSSVSSKTPFTAFWNVPSYDCLHLFNVSLHLEKYGIKANKDENFTGDEIVIFYADELGYYPQFNKSLQPINGGLPQVADLDAHLEKATKDVLDMIPNPEFKGIAIVDWESWRPQWVQNFDTRDIYRRESIKLVQERHRDWDNDTVELLAILEFEQAAKYFMESTLKLVTQLRPNGRWGFYHFPYCYNENNQGRVCSDEAVASNDNITWLFDASTALYPSYYLPESETQMFKFVEGRITEALRVRKESNNPHTDIYPYTRYVYKRSHIYLNKKALNATILRAAEMGCSGVVFWGSSEDYHTAESCQELKNYTEQFLGPFVKNVTDASNVCSELVCSGNGRCVGDIMACGGMTEKFQARNDRRKTGVWENAQQWWKNFLFPCLCKCYEGWYGASCTKKTENST